MKFLLLLFAIFFVVNLARGIRAGSIEILGFVILRGASPRLFYLIKIGQGLFYAALLFAGVRYISPTPHLIPLWPFWIFPVVGTVAFAGATIHTYQCISTGVIASASGHSPVKRNDSPGWYWFVICCQTLGLVFIAYMSTLMVIAIVSSNRT